jgi:hypothetical protein
LLILSGANPKLALPVVTIAGCSFSPMYPIWCEPMPLYSERRSQDLIGHKTGSNRLKPATGAVSGVWGIHQAETAPPSPIAGILMFAT